MAITREAKIQVKNEISGLRDVQNLGDAYKNLADKARKVPKELSLMQKVLKELRTAFTGFADIKAGWDFLSGAIKGTKEAIDDLLISGAKYENLRRNQTIAITDARDATRGLVSDIRLLENANKASALGVASNSKEFAELSRAAVLAAQRMGVDTQQALEQLILGIGRMSTARLDDLGIIVKAEEANAAYARSIGKTTDQLTTAEKQIAFKTAALESLRLANGNAKVSVEGLGNQYQKLKIDIENVVSGLGAMIAGMTTGTGIIAKLSSSVSGLAAQMRGLALGRQAVAKFQAIADPTKADFQDFKRAMGMAIVESFLGMPAEQRIKVAPSVVARLRALGLGDMASDLAMGFSAPEGVGLGGATGKGGGSGAAADIFSALGGNMTLNEEQKRFSERVARERKKAQQEAERRRRSVESGIMSDLDAADFEEQERLRMKREDEARRRRGDFTDDEKYSNMIKALDAAELSEKQQMLALSSREAERAMESQFQASLKLSQATAELDRTFNNIALGGLSNIVSGLWSAADAAIQSGGSFGRALLDGAKSVLQGIAQQATALSLFEFAKSFAAAATGNFAAAALHKSAGFTFLAAGAAAGIASLAISAATAPSGSGGRQDAPRASGRGAGTRNGVPRPSFGERRQDEQREIRVNVFLGDKFSPAAQMIMQSQIKAQLAS